MDKINQTFCEIEKLENGNVLVLMDKDAEMEIEAPPDKKLISENISNVIINIFLPGRLGSPKIFEFQFTEEIIFKSRPGA